MMSKSIFGHLFLPVNADIGEQPVLTVLIFQIYWKILQIISCETMIKLERPSFNILNYNNNNYDNLLLSLLYNLVCIQLRGQRPCV